MVKIKQTPQRNRHKQCQTQSFRRFRQFVKQIIYDIRHDLTIDDRAVHVLMRGAGAHIVELYIDIDQCANYFGVQHAKLLKLASRIRIIKKK